MSELPEFISEKAINNSNIEAPEIETSWASKNISKIMLWFSVAWFVIVFTYITKYFGWSNLFLMMPDEFGGFLAGVTLPLGAIWVVMAYVDRGTNFKNEAKFLRAYMNQLVHPEEGGAQTTKAMADAIRSQVIELQEVTKEANAQSLNIRKGLEVKVDEFSKLVDILDKYSTGNMQEFSDRVDHLIKNFEYINQASSNATDGLKTTLAEISNVSHTISVDLSTVFNNIAPQVAEFKNISQELYAINADNLSKMEKSNQIANDFADRTVQNVNVIAGSLFDQTQKLENVSQSVMSSVKEMQDSLNERVSEVGKILDSQGNFITSHIKEIDKANNELTHKISAQADVVTAEVEKVMTRSSLAAESIESQVSNLNSVADSIHLDMENVASVLNNTTQSFAANTTEIVENINKATEIVNNSAVNLENVGKNSLSVIDNINENLQQNSSQWNNTYNEIYKNYDDLYQDISNKTTELKGVSAQAVDDITDVGNTMNKFAGDLTQTCSLVLAQNKQSEISLAQQQKSLNTSISFLESSRVDIKKQVEDLSATAQIINEEAIISVNNLKSQMQEALHLSEDVVTQTRVVNDSLKEQSKDFSNSTAHTLSTMKDFDATLQTHNKELAKTSSNLEEKNMFISNNLEKQINLIDKNVDTSNKKYESILSLFTEQTNILNSVTEKTINYVADVVSSLDEKAEVINALFQHQEETFLSFCDKISENTTDVSGKLKQQINTMEQTANKIFVKMESLDEDITNRSSIVFNSASSTMDKITEAGKFLEEKSNSALDSMSTVEKNFLTTAQNVSNNLNEFKDSVANLDELSSEVNKKVSNSSKNMQETNKKLIVDTNKVCDLLTSKSNSVDAFLLKVQAQAETLKDVFDSQKESLTNVANVVATQTRLGETSLNQQYKVLSDASIEVAKKLDEIQAKFKNNMDFVTDTSSRVSYEIDTLGDKLIKISEDVEKSSKEAVKNVQSVGLNLEECESSLAKSVKQSSEKLGGAITSYEGNIANFNTITAEASAGVFEINALISDQSDKMIKISEDTKELVTCFNTVLNDTSLELSNRANFAFDKVKGLGENLKTLSSQLEDAGKLSSQHLDASGDKLRAQIGEISANAERISNSILSSGDTFLKKSDVLVVATNDTLVKVKKVVENLEDSAKSFATIGDMATQKSATFSNLVDTQLTSLTQIVSQADSKIAELLVTKEDISAEKFIKESSYIIETIETAAVDIAKVINPDNAEDLWKKYYNGDNSIFVRYLSKSLTKVQAAAIKSLYEQNGDFRQIVTRYLSEFEDLLNKAQRNERAGIILSVITSADIGKVYYILAKALDKLN